MKPDARCPDCGAPMEEGWTMDVSFGAAVQACWHRDPPEPRTFLGSPAGVKVTEGKVLPIQTFRCPKCGLLRSYAPTKGKGE